jgi:hypothetical protein
MKVWGVDIMTKVTNIISNLLLDVFSSVKGFFYGFTVIGLVIVLITGIVYLLIAALNTVT